MKNSTDILRYLETNPKDVAARIALHDALMEEQTDEVLATGVHFLVVHGLWPVRSKVGTNEYYIASSIGLGIAHRPFSEQTFARTVEGCLRLFSAYLWEFRQLTIALFGDAPVAAVKEVEIAGMRLPKIDPEAASAIEEAMGKWTRSNQSVKPWVEPKFIRPA